MALWANRRCFIYRFSDSNLEMKHMALGFYGALAILFIALKLLGVIAWPWLWVLAPMWGGLVVWLAILALLGFFFIVLICVEGAKKFFQRL